MANPRQTPKLNLTLQRVYPPKYASDLDMPSTIRRFSAMAAICVVLSLLSTSPANAQQMIADVALPDSPGFALQQQQQQPTPPATESTSSTSSPQPTKPDPSGTPPQQTKRILGIMPNFSAVSADTKLPPQTPKEKFKIAAKNSFDYSSFVIAAIQSGISFASNSYPEFGHGAAGYGKYYYHTLLDTANSNFMVAGVFPVVFRQDNRFYTLGRGRVSKRMFYAATRVLVTRNDSGNNAFNASEIVGTGAAAGISTIYYPDTYTTWTKVGQRWLTSCIIDSANYTFKEFWPDINHKLFHTK